MATDRPTTELATLLGELLAAYRDDSYKARFDWIDHLAEVKNVKLVEHLDTNLVEQLRCKDTLKTHLAAPENIKWDEVESFKIGGAGRKVFEDLDLDAYLEAMGKKIASLSLKALKNRRVQIR